MRNFASNIGTGKIIQTSTSKLCKLLIKERVDHGITQEGDFTGSAVTVGVLFMGQCYMNWTFSNVYEHYIMCDCINVYYMGYIFIQLVTVLHCVNHINGNIMLII